MFEIRVTCAPAESEGILAALSDVFHTKDVNHLPAGHADKERLYLTGEHRPQDTRPTMWQHVQTVVAWLNISNANTSHETAMRLLKVTEEAGEAVQAYLGAAGQNPRKGFTHSPDDVADELCDVILAAAVALHSFADDPEAVLNATIRKRGERLASQPESGPMPGDAYATAPCITREIAWIARTARTVQHLSASVDDRALEREYFLRKAAVFDRIALTDGTEGHSTNHAAAQAAAETLRDIDDEPATSDARAYLRQQYALWAKNQ